jgi:hypothetical protein
MAISPIPSSGLRVVESTRDERCVPQPPQGSAEHERPPRAERQQSRRQVAAFHGPNLRSVRHHVVYLRADSTAWPQEDGDAGSTILRPDDRFAPAVHPDDVLTAGLLGVPWLIWGGVCLVLAAVYAVVWPRPRRAAPGWRRLVLRWAHALVWLALAGSCLLRAASGPTVAADALAQAAALLYAAFLGAVVIDRARGRPHPRGR